MITSVLGETSLKATFSHFLYFPVPPICPVSPVHLFSPFQFDYSIPSPFKAKTLGLRVTPTPHIRTFSPTSSIGTTHHTPNTIRGITNTCCTTKVRDHARPFRAAGSLPWLISMAGGRLLTLACDSCRVRKVKCDAQPRQSPIGESPRGTIPDSPTNGLSDIVSPVKITSTLPLAELSHVDRFPAHVSPTIASRIESHHRQDRASVELTLLSEERLPTPTEIQEALAKDLMTLGSSVDHAARKCIDVFMQYSYPLIPIVQPTNLISSIALLSRPLLPDETTPQSRHSSGLSMKSLEEFRAFTLLTALCASIYAGTNSSMFAHFEERDIEHPTSSSLVIRVLQSSAFHCLGKTHIALYVLSNAHHLALLMRLYDERSFDDMPQPEATIMRAVVWTLYVADKSASVLNHVPSTVQEVCLQEPLTLAYEREGDFGLLSPDMPLFTCSYESRLQAGFTLKIASDLVAAATTVPFEALRANSEPCVEKLRQAGVDLLQITHKTTNQALCARAKTIFSTLLDLIATLNSKVSNELSMGFPN
ncbi:hypothetical protein HYQ45_004063 [Verticillium longisporum]|uniref:Transcription factor domain-containing protein n=1 Tax=Verticillium longisporum TaxID=100787 RepID=A0A8I3AUR5_VERLO|nr:hypothetical protein HYQ45_004063 [Verticillium longisporum]